MNAYRPRTRSGRILLQELPDEVLIYDMERDQVHCLNGAAARVWSLCDGTRTVADIAAIVAPELEEATGASLVWCALDQFRERHLLEESEDESIDDSKPADLTRRQIVLRLGLAVATLPIVESIVSPPAAQAASGACGPCGPTPP